ncbi:MAG: DUF2235 domain-containing protein [Methylomonas sp.]|nr:DUF2235 domain-containing protein [Methylomonas sp.]
MPKTIIFCADGTWNGPDQDDNNDRQPDPTNVFKLFLSLAGDETADSAPLQHEQEKRLTRDGATLQVSKYIHGVGDTRNPINKVLGGVFGAGIIARIVRGYTFISREYEPGDHIVVIGFSRGAYTVRALAGMIAKQGLLAKRLTTDKTDAYRWGARAWYHYRKDSGQGNWWTRLVGGISNLPGFIGSSAVDADDLQPVESIRAVAVWDTVGALGFPRYNKDSRADVFEFANTRLSDKVERGIHAVSLDEQRVDFTPTLWDSAGHVEQMLFAGAHADVGGGYTSLNKESGLSDIALQWMMEKLMPLSVQFGSTDAPALNPDPAGTAHQPWRHFPFADGKKSLRQFAGKGLIVHESVRKRMEAGPVIADPGLSTMPYRPENLPRQ